MGWQRLRAGIVAVIATVAVTLTASPAMAEPTPSPRPGEPTPSASATPTVTPSSAVPNADPSTSTASPSVPPPPAPLAFGPANARASMIAFSWLELTGATRYRLRVATSAGGVPLAEVEAVRPAALVSALKPNTRYFAQVIALGPDGAQIGVPSPELTVTTPYPLDAPTVQAKVTSSVGITLSWLKAAKGTTLQLEWKAPGTKAKVTKPGSNRVVKSGLKADTGYRVRARLVHGRTVLSAWSKPITPTTLEGDPLRVGSYNIQCANCRAWGPRRQGVADTIVNQKLDVVGLQEASAAALNGSDTPQYRDLARLLAPAGYRFTNLTRYNCRRSDSISKCKEFYRGASGSIRIAYRTSTLRLISQGSRQLADLPGTGNDRFIAWGVFEQKVNGKRFLFTSTHLEPDNDSPGSTRFYNIRRAQAQHVVRTIQAQRHGLPVVAVGDYNSTKWDVPTNAPYDVMRSAGFIDPLGNTYRSTNSAPGATVEKRINTQFMSYNDLQAQARHTEGINGSNPDYIFVSPMRVVEWETVLSVTSTGRFTSTPPSDHNLIRATLLLR